MTKVAWMLLAAVGTAEPPAERVIALPAALDIVAAVPRFRFEAVNGVVAHLDAASLGALALADLVVRIPTPPASAVPPMGMPGSRDEPGAMVVDWSPTAGRLEVRMGTVPLTAIALPPGVAPRRLAVVQQDRLALLVFPAVGGPGTWVWSGGLDYVLRLPESEQYALCREMTARAGDRRLERSEVLQGIRWDQVDRIAPVRVEGVSPGGDRFVHVYPLDPAELEDRAVRALGELVRTLRAGAWPAGAAGGR